MTNTNNGACIKCNGTLWLEEIRGDEVESRPCACLQKKIMLDFLGPELAKAKHRRSELYMPTLDPETNQMIGDRTLDNLFIKGEWSEAASHLRWALGCKKYAVPGFTYLMVNDEKLVRVYMGDFAYHNRSRRVRDEIETYNNLNDLIFGQSLVIVRLGKMGWKNRAAGGILREALNIRSSEARPIWLIEGPYYFGDGHLLYNPEVGRLIEETFDVVDVGGDVEAERQLRAELDAIEGDTVALESGEAEAPAPPVETKERFFAVPGSLEDRGKAHYKRTKWSKGKKTPSGGLPGL